MKERCCTPGCSRSAEAFRDPSQSYTEGKYKAYCTAHGGDERAREDIRHQRSLNTPAQNIPTPNKRPRRKR